MMKVLVTGGGGFVGSHLVDSQLARGNAVRAVDLHTDRLNHAVTHPNLEVSVGDITDRDSADRFVNGVDVVYHLASAHLDVTLAHEDYRRVNVDATRDLLEAARIAGVRCFVHCSTNGVIGNLKNPPADETTECRPTNIYERTKLEGEQIALQFHRETGFPVVVVRPAWVYGPRCPRTEKLIRTVGKGRFVMFGDGRTLRHPIFISDAVDGLALCAEVPEAAGQVYFMAGAEPVTIEALVRTVAEVVGSRPPIIRLPIGMGKLAGQALQIAYKPLDRQPPFSRIASPPSRDAALTSLSKTTPTI
jgi:nucleoside-diphosphate-sugar epimerase